MPEENGKPIFEVWEKYEDIAMHFNDMLIKLRTQAIGGVAAITTIVAAINKNTTTSTFHWDLMVGVFFFLCIFWVAVWVLDFSYYNRLLHGAVDALFELEKQSETKTHITELKLSHIIEDAVAGKGTKKYPELHKKLSSGRKWFYQIVFLGLLFGLLFSLYKYLC